MSHHDHDDSRAGRTAADVADELQHAVEAAQETLAAGQQGADEDAFMAQACADLDRIDALHREYRELTARSRLSEVGRAALATLRRLEEVARDKPLPALGVAAAAGFVLGLLLHRDR